MTRLPGVKGPATSETEANRNAAIAASATRRTFINQLPFYEKCGGRGAKDSLRRDQREAREIRIGQEEVVRAVDADHEREDDVEAVPRRGAPARGVEDRERQHRRQRHVQKVRGEEARDRHPRREMAEVADVLLR